MNFICVSAAITTQQIQKYPAFHIGSTDSKL